MVDKVQAIIKKNAFISNASGRFQIGPDDYLKVIKGRADVFIAGAAAQSKEAPQEITGRLIYLASAYEGDALVFFEVPEGFTFIIRCINDSMVSLIEREREDYQKLREAVPEAFEKTGKEWNKRLKKFLYAENNRFESGEPESRDALKMQQKEIIRRIIKQIKNDDERALTGIQETARQDGKEYEKARARLNELYTREENRQEHQKRIKGHPLLRACTLVGKEQGLTITEMSGALLEAAADPLQTIAKKAGFKYRQFNLDGDWFKRDLGSFISWNQDDEVLAIVKNGGGYLCHNMESGAHFKVTADNASNIVNKGYYLYKPLPRKPVSFIEFFQFAFSPLKTGTIVNIVLFGAIFGLLSALVPVITGYTIENQIPARQRTELLQIVLFLLATGISATLFNLIKFRMTSKLEFKTDMKMQTALWDRLINLPASFFRHYSSGEIGKKVIGFYRMRLIISTIISDTLLSAIFSVFFVVILFFYSPEMALAAMGISLLNVVVILITGYFQIKTGYEKLRNADRLSGVMLEMFFSIAKIRLSASEKRVFANWSRAYTRYKENDIREKEIHHINSLYISVMTIISTIIIFYMAYTSGNLSIGGFVAFNSAFVSFQAVLASLSNTTLSLSTAYALLKNTKPILDEIPEKAEDKAGVGEIKGEIEFNNCSFRYEKHSKEVFSNLNMTIEDGDYVAIVGASGSGKSTMMRLILGFEQPSAGKVYVGGRDLEEVDITGIRKQMGVVLQNSKLLSGDLFMNIAGSDPRITEEEVLEACEKAGIKEDVEALPMGLNTFINDSTSTISGGQKQRILIARALIQKPKILLFDEATSALDNHTQRIVTDTLKSLNTTRVIIAHRLSTVKACDRIYVLNAGRIAESGSYDELMAKKGLFYKLVERQVM